MDWQLAIEKNREALRRVLAMLVAMVGVAAGNAERPATLPRHLHRFVLRLLRPAEAATRRLIIVAARGLAVELAPPRAASPRPPSIFVRAGIGTGIVRIGSMPPRTPPRRLALPLLDPLKRFGRRKYVKRRDLPRITFDYDRPREPDPPPLTPDDPLDSSRVHRRIDALASALDDLPGQANRFARWQARRDRWQDAQESDRDAACEPRKGAARSRRLSPMRPGRPPGWRRRPAHAVDDVLAELHGLAVWALSRPDTS